MDNFIFINICIETVKEFYKGIDNVVPFIVWSCKTLQNNKAILSINQSDNKLFEFTYNGDKKEVYIDIYEKKSNKVIDLK